MAPSSFSRTFAETQLVKSKIPDFCWDSILIPGREWRLVKCSGRYVETLRYSENSSHYGMHGRIVTLILLKSLCWAIIYSKYATTQCLGFNPCIFSAIVDFFRFLIFPWRPREKRIKTLIIFSIPFEKLDISPEFREKQHFFRLPYTQWRLGQRRQPNQNTMCETRKIRNSHFTKTQWEFCKF